MKFITRIFIILLLPILVKATDHKYFIRFADKSNNSFSINNPSAFLSERSIARRQAKGIAVTEQDLPVDAGYVNAVNVLGANVLTRSKWFNGVTVECDSSELMNILALPFVVSAKQVFSSTAPRTLKDFKVEPGQDNDELKSAYYDYGGSFNQIHLMNGEYLNEAGYKGEGMIIALLDAGFYSVDQLAPFQNVRDRNSILATWDFVAGDASVYEDDGHGMSVLSTIAGYVNGQLVGTAPNAQFLLLRSEDVSSENIIEEFNWDAAAEYADSAGADLISSSLGYTLFDDTLSNHSYADMDGNHCPSTIAADIAASKGILVLVSAGNSGFDQWHYIGAPSDGDSVISVGGVDANGNHAFFSSWGPSSDNDIKPNVAAKGIGCSIADGVGGVSLGNGTSFACPILAGSAACLWQAHPDATAMQIKKAIERSANYYYAPNDTMGYGIPDFRLANYLLSTGDGTLPMEDFVVGVYPNPYQQELKVKFFSTTDQTLNIEIINTVGQVVKSVDEKAVAWTINYYILNDNLSGGVYFLRINAEEQTYTTRVFHE